MTGKPIAKKYCEGKVKRTLKRELKVLEIVKREANGNKYCHRHSVFLKGNLMNMKG